VAVFRFAKDHFEVESKKAAPVYPVSYDCAKTGLMVEQAICHVESLAVLDRSLDEKYRALCAKLPRRTAVVQAEQTDWREKRNAVTIYKWWVDELSKLYQERIAAVDERTAKIKPSAPRRSHCHRRPASRCSRRRSPILSSSSTERERSPASVAMRQPR